MTPWERIHELMEKNRVNSKELADVAGVVPSAVTKWKSGSSIRNDALSRIALHFGVSTDYLMSGAREKDDIALEQTAGAAINALHDKIRLQSQLIDSQRQTIESQKMIIETLQQHIEEVRAIAREAK